MLFLITFSTSVGFTRISYSIDFTHVWSKLYKKHTEKKYNHFINPLFYELLHFWTILNVYYEVKISHIILFLYLFYRYDSYLSYSIPFYELKTTVLCQNDYLMNHAAKCEVFLKIITHVKYLSKYSKLHIIVIVISILTVIIHNLKIEHSKLYTVRRCATKSFPEKLLLYSKLITRVPLK